MNLILSLIIEQEEKRRKEREAKKELRLYLPIEEESLPQVDKDEVIDFDIFDTLINN